MGVGEYLNSLEDGWTIYLWLVSGVLIVISAVFAIRWAAQNDQFDEDIKYVVFDEKDEDKMDPEEFKKAMKVNKEQEEKRVVALRLEREEKAKRAANK